MEKIKRIKTKDPVEILKEEHEITEKSLDILEFFCRLCLDKVLVSDVKELLEFFDQFVDKCHHTKEEDLLFPLIEKRGIPKEGGPIGVMPLEHDEGRELRKSMLEASKSLNKNQCNIEPTFGCKPTIQMVH